MYTVYRISDKQGTQRTEYIDMADWIANRDVSDRGKFLDVLETGIYWSEFLGAMQPRAQAVVMSRLALGYSWEETAGFLGSSVNAAQKALSSGVRKSVGICMRELRRGLHRKPAGFKTRRKRNDAPAL
jgi:DNA-directed RNA polymerase specialized sigma24 family protein